MIKMTTHMYLPDLSDLGIYLVSQQQCKTMYLHFRCKFQICVCTIYGFLHKVKDTKIFFFSKHLGTFP